MRAMLPDRLSAPPRVALAAMLPVLFEVGGLPVPTHEFFIGVGLLAAVVVFVFEARRRGRWDDDLWVVVTGALLGGGIFARVGTGIRYLAEAPDPSFTGMLTQAGRSVLGGLAGAYLGAIVAKKLIGYRRSTGDFFAPAIAIGMAIGRIGCFLTEQIGTTTSLPWGVTVSPEQAATMPFCPQCDSGVPMHPSFLYEIGFHLTAFVLIMRWRHDRLYDGKLFGMYVTAYAVCRFFLEYVRGNPPLWWGLSGSQIFLMLSASTLLGAALVRIGMRRVAPA